MGFRLYQKNGGYFYDTMGELYICVNGNSENFGNYTGLCCEDECDDGEEEFNEF